VLSNTLFGGKPLGPVTHLRGIAIAKTVRRNTNQE
jgi:hypothetical protein